MFSELDNPSVVLVASDSTFQWEEVLSSWSTEMDFDF